MTFVAWGLVVASLAVFILAVSYALHRVWEHRVWFSDRRMKGLPTTARPLPTKVQRLFSNVNWIRSIASALREGRTW